MSDELTTPPLKINDKEVSDANMAIIRRLMKALNTKRPEDVISVAVNLLDKVAAVTPQGYEWGMVKISPKVLDPIGGGVQAIIIRSPELDDLRKNVLLQSYAQAQSPR